MEPFEIVLVLLSGSIALAAAWNDHRSWQRTGADLGLANHGKWRDLSGTLDGFFVRLRKVQCSFVIKIDGRCRFPPT